MITGSHHDHVIRASRRKLQQRATDDTLNFSSFMGVTPLFTQSLEFIEETKRNAASGIVKNVLSIG